MKSLLTDRNVRRMLVLLLFVGLLATFRHLFILLVFFVVFQRLIGSAAEYVHVWTKVKFKWCVLIVVFGMLGLITAGVFVGVEAIVSHVPKIRHSVDSIVAAVKASPIYQRYASEGSGFSTAELLHKAQEHAGSAMQFAATIGRDTLYVFIALVFSIVFLLERDELEHWREHMPMDSAPRILLRYLGHVTDAIAITLKLQVIVALVNTAVTVPVLLALRLPGIPALIALMLVSGLIPVVGGPIAGAVLMTLAFLTRGPVGLGVFIVSTFVLHKIESYYLNPRLTAKHVKLPSFVIITSLILFEEVFGLVGVFLSFPCLYVAAKIREGWIDPEYEAREEAEAMRAMRGMLPRLQGFKLKPGVLGDAGAVVGAPGSGDVVASGVAGTADAGGGAESRAG